MLQKLEECIRTCDTLFLEGFYANNDVSYKGTVDLVTKYDLAIEKLLSEKLQLLFPQYTLVGEERSQATIRPEKGIYIDPIDGTTNFVHGIAYCAISVGVWDEKGPLYGVVYNPVLNECFCAERGKGATCNAERINVSAMQELQQSLLATGFPYTKVERGADFEWVLKSMRNLLPISRDIRRLGSASIDLCYVARGVYDGFYECNLKPWDVAAGVLIVQEAGGRISNHRGDDYTLDDPVIVATNAAIHGQLVAELAEY